MALSIEEAPVYGGNTLVIEFPAETQLATDASFYIVYEGTQRRHVTSARRLTANKLHSVVPGHNEAESVRLSVFSFCAEEKVQLARSEFKFRTDGAFFLAQFLVDSVYNPQILEDLELIKSDHFDLSNEDTSTLDKRLSRALVHLDIPEWWSLLGSDAGKAEPEPRETILHFAARLGLERVATFLISKPGSQIGLRLRNRNGNLPKDVALSNGYLGLAELLSEYNAVGLMPLGRWYETDQGTIQTQETGDVSFTSKLLTHNRTVEEEQLSYPELKDEDIVLLKRIQRQLEEDDSALRQWQTHWPSNSPIHTENEKDIEKKIERKFENIHQKVKELPDIVSMETADNYRDNQADNCSDSNLQTEQRDLNTANDLPGDEEETVTEKLPELHISEEAWDQEDGNLDIMEGSVSALRGYNEHLQRIREKSVVFNRILEQDLRKENLARFSSSCPSLDVNTPDVPLPTIDEADTSKSMLDLAENGERPKADSTGSIYSEDLYSSGNDLNDPNVHIVVDGVTADESSEAFGTQTQEYDEFLHEYYGGNIPNVRRRSQSPKEVSRQRADGSLPQSDMLAQDGKRSVSFNSLEGEEDSEEDDSFQDASDVSSGVVSVGKEGPKRATHSTGDLEDISNDDQDINPPDADTDDASSYQLKRSPKKGRGHGGSARYSADIESMMHKHSVKEGISGSSLDERQMLAGPRTEDSREEEAGTLSAPHSKMTKALSTSSIPAATRAEGLKGISRKGFNRESKQADTPSHLLIQKLIAEHDAQFKRQTEIEEDEEERHSSSPTRDSDTTSKTRSRRKGQVSLIDFLNEEPSYEYLRSRRMGQFTPPLGFHALDDGAPSPAIPKEEKEKKRKTSMFSRFHSSVRTKKGKEKENKGKSSHQFVSASFSNSTMCDSCNKTLANKAALRCEFCLLNVHEGCKDQLSQCDKFRPRGHHGATRQGSGEMETVGRSSSERNGHQPLSTIGVSNLRSYSFKEKSRPASAFVPSSIHSQSELQPDFGEYLRRRRDAMVTQPRKSLPTSLYSSLNTGTYLQWRRASVAVDRVISEEGEPNLGPGLDLGQPQPETNITTTISQSLESLDEVDATSEQELGRDDSELQSLLVNEADTWSVTADKRTLKKLSTKDVKRQDTIWELIQTERHHCLNLKILQRFFRDSMISELNLQPAWVERLFPHLDDLIAIHMSFLKQLHTLQNKKADRSIDDIGPTLASQFSGTSSESLKVAYGAFCSGHLMAIQLYKDQIAKDRKFHVFCKQRTNHPLCHRREIPDFILLVTQRPTKYPTLIEAIIKGTKDKKDRENLLRALSYSKDVLQNVNERVADAEREMRLRDIYQRMDARTTGLKGGKKFRKSDLLANGRKLLHEAAVGWRNARGKYTDVILLVLTDVLVFMQESNQKFVFFSHDNKFGVVSLFNLLVREKGDTRDSKGLYLISQNKQMPEMYELVCRSPSERHECIKKLRSAVEKCPEEEEEIQTEADEEQRRQQERMNKAKQIMDQLKEQDEEIKKRCDVKNKLMVELVSVYSGADEQPTSNSRPNSHDFEEAMEHTGGTLQAAIQEVSKAASQLSTMLQGNGSNLSRSVSSVGEHTSQSYTAVAVTKRAETFAGFDSNYEMPKVTKKREGIDAADYGESPRSSLYQGDSESDLTQYSDVPGPTYTRYDPSDAESGRGSSPGALSSVSALSPMAAPIEQVSAAHLLNTLNSIVHLTASQGTAVESLRAQLSEANERINKLSAEVHEKKSGYRHNQLEELRNLQGQVQKEKMEWEREKEKNQAGMERERSSLEEFRKQLEQQESEIKTQREDLKKQRQVLQRQTEMLQAQGKLPQSASPSSTDTGECSEEGNVQSNTDFQPGHRRSASAEFYPSKNSNADESKSVPKNVNDSFRSEQRPSITKLQSFSAGNKQNLPVHLLSAKNEQKMGSKNVQQLPSKLLSTSSASSLPSQPGLVSVEKGRSYSSSQLLPGSGSNNGHPSQNSAGSHGGSSHGNKSKDIGSPKGQSDSQFGSSHSAGNLVNFGTSDPGQGQGRGNVGSSVQQVPAGGRQSNRPKPSNALGGLSGVMKLAEKGEKKGRSSSQSGLQAQAPQGADKSAQPSAHEERPKSSGQGRGSNVKHKPQKSDSDVIYF